MSKVLSIFINTSILFSRQSTTYLHYYQHLYYLYFAVYNLI